MLAEPLEHMKHANEETFLLQIEDREAVDSIEEIAAVEGVDLLFVDPGHLTFNYGVPLEVDHPLIQKATGRVAAATAKQGRWWGMTSGSPESVQALLDRGALFLTCGGYHGGLVNGLCGGLEEHKGLHVERATA